MKPLCLVRSVPAGTGAPNTALTHPRELPCDRFLCESPPMIGRTAGAFGTALAPRHGSSFLPLRLLFPRSWATPLSGSPPKPGIGFFYGQARRPDHPIPPVRLPTFFALPPHQGEPWSQELFHTPILRLTTNTQRFSQQQPAPFSWSVCVRQRGRNCLPDVTGLARGFFSYRRQPLEPLIRILRTPTSLRLSADNSPDAFRVRPRPRDPVRHAHLELVIQFGGRSR